MSIFIVQYSDGYCTVYIEITEKNGDAFLTVLIVEKRPQRLPFQLWRKIWKLFQETKITLYFFKGSVEKANLIHILVSKVR